MLTVVEEGQKTDCYLNVIDETEAVVKGYGRNARQTVILSKDKGRYLIDIDGVRLKGKKTVR